MAYEQRPNSGTLFKNKQKQDGDRKPEYRGDSLHQCPSCNHQFKQEMSAWIKPTSNGGKLMSLSFKPPYKKDGGQPQEPMRGISPSDVPANPPVEEDDVPF